MIRRYTARAQVLVGVTVVERHRAHCEYRGFIHAVDGCHADLLPIK